MDVIPAKNKLLEICNQIISLDLSSLDLGFTGGKSGVALFLFYYYRYSNDKRAADLALRLLYNCIEDIENGNIFYSYSNGLAGLGCVVQNLSENQIIDIHTQKIFADFNDYLKRKMFQCLEEGNIDFLHGGLGIAYYFLKMSDTKTLLEFIIKLVEISKKNNYGIYWETSINIGEKEEKGINLGLAHGIFSIVSFLNNVILSNLLPEQMHYLKEQLVKINEFILSNKQANNQLNSFPTWNTPNDKMNYSRLAWCYGDLSGGLVLLNSSILVKNENWYNESIAVLQKTLDRMDVDRESVYDAGFCHGSSGLAYLYYKVFKLTDFKQFLYQSNYWINVTINKATFSDGYAGYKSFHHNEGWLNSVGTLEGITGIGLVLLSRLDHKASNWDNLFLI